MYPRGMKVYERIRDDDGCRVTADGKPLNLRTDLRNHSPTGGEWGFAGSGPAQLALALIADAVGDDVALLTYQKFKFEVVAGFENDGWTMTQAEIRCWVAALLARKSTPPDDRPQE